MERAIDRQVGAASAVIQRGLSQKAKLSINQTVYYGLELRAVTERK